MKEKWFTFKRLTSIATVFLLLAGTSMQAQVQDSIPGTGHQDSIREASAGSSLQVMPRRVFRDTVFIVKHDTVWLTDADTAGAIKVEQPRPSKYDRRIHRYRTHWESLIPTHTKLQYAGNMGLLSIGPGWDYGKRNQWETDLLIGFLPKYQSDKCKITLTLKQNYIPWSLQIKESRFSVEPLTCGLYVNTVFGDEFWVNEPDRYPKGYYGFSSKVRFHVFLGQRLTFDIDRKRRFMAKQVTVFYEISTCDLYVVSAFTNKYLKPKDYLSLSFGIKMQML